MRWCGILSAVIFLVSVTSAAQDTLQVVSSSAPLPDDLRTKFGWGDLRVGCGKDGRTLLALVESVEKTTHEIVALTPSGTVEARIDMENVPGLDRADIEDFAPGPNGEIYVAAKRVAWERFERDQKGEIKGAYRSDDPTIWLVRFSPTGQLLAQVPIQVGFGLMRMAVFPSGALLAVGYLAPSRLPFKRIPFWGIISRDGTLVGPVKTPEAVLAGEWRKRGYTVLPVPILAEDGNIYVMTGEENPFLSVVGADGTVVRSVRLRIPDGSILQEPRLAGQRLIAAVVVSKQDTTAHLAELDVQTGDLLLLHSVLGPGGKLTCQGQSGIVTLSPQGGFDVLGANVGVQSH